MDNEQDPKPKRANVTTFRREIGKRIFLRAFWLLVFFLSAFTFFNGIREHNIFAGLWIIPGVLDAMFAWAAHEEIHRLKQLYRQKQLEIDNKP